MASRSIHPRSTVASPRTRRAEIHILRNRAGRHGGIAFPLADRDHGHAPVIGDENEIERRLVDEVLIARDTAHVMAGDKFEIMTLRSIPVGALGKGQIDVDLLRIEGRRGGAMAVGAADTKGSPQQIREHGEGDLGGGKFAVRPALRERVHQRQSAMLVWWGQGYGGSGLPACRFRTQPPHHAKRQLCQRSHDVDLGLHVRRNESYGIPPARLRTHLAKPFSGAGVILVQDISVSQMRRGERALSCHNAMRSASVFGPRVWRLSVPSAGGQVRAPVVSIKALRNDG